MYKKKFELAQKRMILSLDEIRESLSHKGDRGSSAEEVLREFLRQYLPIYNRVGEGEVINVAEIQSTQLDVVVTNEYHPSLGRMQGPETFIIEGVAAVGEVKTNLNSNDINTLIQSCIRFKSITPTNIGGMMGHWSKSDRIRFVEHRPYFLFVYESQLNIETIKQKLQNYYSVNSIPVVQQIDAVFCLDRGTIWNFGDGQGSMEYVVNGVPQSGLHVTNQDKSSVLFDLMTWFSVLPRYSYPHSPMQLYLVP
ncbi:DUF6602 domain-containing protein [Vibrio cholerae]|nr:hypothetical protein [Vibrio cholerae]EIJ2221477.1 hypothetical protein [Vibrio cholerae]EJL6998795.1 hypothetical protein [Vibrio cholerae]EKF9882802.1 hypothetical protein [Vibrio cholerae]